MIIILAVNDLHVSTTNHNLWEEHFQKNNKTFNFLWYQMQLTVVILDYLD